jgi:hypothetical protein
VGGPRGRGGGGDAEENKTEDKRIRRSIEGTDLAPLWRPWRGRRAHSQPRTSSRTVFPRSPARWVLLSFRRVPADRKSPRILETAFPRLALAHFSLEKEKHETRFCLGQAIVAFFLTIISYV